MAVATLYEKQQETRTLPVREISLKLQDSLLGEGEVSKARDLCLVVCHSSKRLHAQRDEVIQLVYRITNRADRTRLREERRDRQAAELAWIRVNRARFGGQWVALVGNRLLASGLRAREVHAEARNMAAHESPLIAYIEPLDELPFAGW